ncbi:MAG: LAGLIDADG family homing endonuclease [Nitrososphaerota archaeon]
MKRRAPYLSRELRIKLYEDVISQRQQGLSYNNIIDFIREKHGVTLRKSHISNWVNGLHSPYVDAGIKEQAKIIGLSIRINNPYHATTITSLAQLKPCKELAYIIGAVSGDGAAIELRKPNNGYHDKVIALMVHDRDFAEEFARCLETVLNRKPPKISFRPDSLRFCVKVRSAALYYLLKKPLDIEKIKHFIEYSDECKAAFLRGLFDSEGSVSRQGVIRLYNSDLTMLGYVKSLLHSLGMQPREPRLHTRAGTFFRSPANGKMYQRRKNVYELYLSTKHSLAFYRRVGFTISRKQQTLENYLIRRRLLLPSSQTLPSFLSLIINEPVR